MHCSFLLTFFKAKVSLQMTCNCAYYLENTQVLHHIVLNGPSSNKYELNIQKSGVKKCPFLPPKYPPESNGSIKLFTVLYFLI